MDHQGKLLLNEESNGSESESEQDSGTISNESDEVTDDNQPSDVTNKKKSYNLRSSAQPSAPLPINEVKERKSKKSTPPLVNQKDNTKKAECEKENINNDKPFEDERNTSKENQKINQKKNLSSNPYFQAIAAIIVLCAAYRLFAKDTPPPPSNDDDWRLKVDPNNSLSHDQQFIVRASLKPILDRYTRDEESVSTLLILSFDEENAANIGRCVLRLVNTKKHKDQISAEIDLKSRHGNKLLLDDNLRGLLGPDGTKKAVLLRRIDDIPTDDAFDQLRLLFAYCDGENPVFRDRLIIMTSNSAHESELRDKLKTRWPKEHDFIDALMSRISGHTLYVEKDQKSIC